ncbi:MAG: PHB depolymerase family esterase, partial [Sphingomonadaceae bacterium]|nr:PHB depolymerase family esterase [Sphingomonadaceae bacterium]
MPLVVMLHGCTQSADDFARGTGMNRLADELGFIVAYPAQSASANAQKCWNWFRPGDQRRDQGEPALIAAVTREIIAERRIDPARVYIAGLSAGGAAAAVMGDAYPDLYAAVGIHSGLACGAARDLPSALMAMKNGGAAAPGRHARFTPVITFHGDRDATVHEANSRRIIAMASAAAGAPLTSKVDKGR